MVRLVFCLLVLLLSAVAHAHGPGLMRARQAVEAVLGTESSSKSARSLVPKASVVPSYDADGNLLHDGWRQFTWDAQNRLTQVETDLAALPAGAPAFRVSFGYDDLGRRIWQKAEGRVAAAWQVVQVRLFMYHGWNVVAEFDTASPATGSPRQLVQSYLWGTDLSGTPQGAGGVGGLLVLTDHRSGGTGAHGYAYDGNGNVLALVALAAGAISARYDHDPFGQPLGSSGPASRLNPYRFSTKYTDPNGVQFRRHQQNAFCWCTAGRGGTVGPAERRFAKLVHLWLRLVYPVDSGSSAGTPTLRTRLIHRHRVPHVVSLCSRAHWSCPVDGVLNLSRVPPLRGPD